MRKRDNKPLVLYRRKCEVDIKRCFKGRRWKKTGYLPQNIIKWRPLLNVTRTVGFTK